MSTAEATIDGEIVNQSEALDIRHPAAPATLEQISALGDGGNEIVRARVQVLQTLRKASIQATSPEDWLLFHAVDRRTGQERTIGYLQDAGCDRVASLWGIEIFGIEKPERVMANDGTPAFMYLIRGSGRCSITGQTVEQMEGGRSSSDDFCKDEKGTALELKVRKAARANLDGNIVRELTGLKSVAISELQAAWEGSKKHSDNCVKARGFGSAQGAGTVDASKVDTSTPVPDCPTCSGPMWDNRVRKQSPNSPDFKCKDKQCGKGVWLNEKKPANGSTANGATNDQAPSGSGASDLNGKRARVRSLFADLGWGDNRQDEFLDHRDLAAFNSNELTEIINDLAKESNKRF